MQYVGLVDLPLFVPNELCSSVLMLVIASLTLEGLVSRCVSVMV